MTWVVGLAAILSATAAWAMAAGWRQAAPRAWPMLELAATVAVVGAWTVAGTGVVHAAWTGRWIPEGLDSALFLAGVVGTLSGNLAGVLFAARLGFDLCLRPVPVGSLGVAAVLGAFSVGVSATYTLVLRAAGVGPPEQAVVSAASDGADAATTAAMLVFIVLLAPITEELLFRGIAFGALRVRIGSAAAHGLTALVFAAAHLADPLVVPPILVLAAMLGALRERSGSVVPPIVAHVVNNGLAMALTLVQG